MRCFVALDVPAPVRAQLGGLQADLRKSGLVATFPMPEQLHVTLAFFGNSADRAVEQRKTALGAFSFPAFDAALDQIGFFPSESRINVVWAGFGKGKHDAMRLQAVLAGALQYRPEKPFFPHVTLARVKQKPDVAALNRWARTRRTAASQSVAPTYSFRADSLTFYESLLGPDGPLYRTLARKKME